MKISADHLQALGTMAAAIAALIALFVAIDQGRVMRAQQHASVWPALQITPSFSGQGGRKTISMPVENSGVGPALIHSVNVTVNGMDIPSHEALLELMPGEPGRSTVDLAGQILAPGKELIMYRYSWPTDGISNAEIFDVHNQTVVSVCYCSVMDRCWTRESAQLIPPQPVASCPVNTFQ